MYDVMCRVVILTDIQMQNNSVKRTIFATDSHHQTNVFFQTWQRQDERTRIKYSDRSTSILKHFQAQASSVYYSV